MIPSESLPSIAATADPEKLQEFQPTNTHRAIAGALLFGPANATITKLAEKAGLSRQTVSTCLQDPEAVAWIVAQHTTHKDTCLAVVHARLLHLALTSRSPAALKLYLQRFDPEFQKFEHNKQVKREVYQQFAQVLNMSQDELERWLSLKERQVIGAPATDSRSERRTSPAKGLE